MIAWPVLVDVSSGEYCNVERGGILRGAKDKK